MSQKKITNSIAKNVTIHQGTNMISQNIFQH